MVVNDTLIVALYDLAVETAQRVVECDPEFHYEGPLQYQIDIIYAALVEAARERPKSEGWFGTHIREAMSILRGK